jgi:hypothetical protein
LTRGTQRHLGLEEGMQVWISITNGVTLEPAVSAVSG